MLEVGRFGDEYAQPLAGSTLTVCRPGVWKGG